MNVLTTFCDLALTAASFDFVTWLVRAMKQRDDSNHEGLHIVLVPQEDGLGHVARKWGQHDEAATMWRLWHIVVAACPLAGRNTSLTLASSRWQATSQRALTEETGGVTWWPEGKQHFMGPLIEAARRGELIPKLQATAAAKNYVAHWFGKKKFITLTTRQQTTDPDRNTDSVEWNKFRDWAEGRWSLICLNDSNVALHHAEGFFSELDIDLRLALYEAAAMNLIGNNGPQELLKFSAAPYLAFSQALTQGWQDHFRKYFAMEPGDQLPWALPDQRLVYKPDTFENMKEEFENWERHGLRG